MPALRARRQAMRCLCITITGNGVVQMNQLSVTGFDSGITLDGNITVVVHGDVLLSEGTGIQLGHHTTSRPSGDLYVDGNVSFGQTGSYGVSVNLDGIDPVTGGQVIHNPPDFRVYVQGARTVRIRQGATIKGVIYAPQSSIEVATATTGSNN